MAESIAEIGSCTGIESRPILHRRPFSQSTYPVCGAPGPDLYRQNRDVGTPGLHHRTEGGG